MTARFIVGDTRAVTATLPDGSVELIMSSPPYFRQREYLPAGHPAKADEIGQEGDPLEFVNLLLDLTAEWRRILNPRTGSIVIELGDKYMGSGGAGGDYDEDGMRAGAPKFGSVRDNGNGPRDKSACCTAELYRSSLAYGWRPFSRIPSPAGRWQIRNTITRCSPNPPVGALGKKWRPATTDLVVATPDDDRRYWDDVATRVAHSHKPQRILTPQRRTVAGQPGQPSNGSMSAEVGHGDANPAGAPLLDWWQIVAGGFQGAHYAVYPLELVEPFIEAMCPRRVCRTCGEPSRRETSDPEYVPSASYRGGVLKADAQRVADGANQWVGANGAGAASVTRQTTTTGWSTCGHPGCEADGFRLDGFHTGTGWRPGVVLDPFAGTFTTGAVATGHGRDAIGIDLDERNANLALERVGPLLLTVEHHDTTTAA